ncbi:MAG: PAS domain S-box protein, partial [Longimicrobiales bacterium]|nr:PAS domain S-box protein [Longimicrobiales bacterium]
MSKRTDPDRPHLPPPLGSPRNLGIIGLVGATFLLLLVLTLSGISALSSIRGYVMGEGLWSKAQKRSIVALHRYARSGSEDHWEEYRQEIAVTLSDRMAREELEEPEPDMAVVYQGFEGGGVPSALHPGMARLFRWARDVQFVDRALEIWAEGDRRIEEVRQLAQELRDARESGDPDTARIEAVLASIDEVDQELTVLEDAFTATLNDGAFQVEAVLRWVLLCIAALSFLGAAAATAFLYHQVDLREAFLERSEARYRTLFEDSVVGTALSNLDGTVIRANAAFAEMLGYDSPDELVGRPAVNLYVDPRDRQALLDRLHEKGAVLMDELLARRKDGSPVWLMTSSALLEDPVDGSKQIVATCLDISGRKEMEERLARKGRIEAMGQLAGGIAHDFNNLLTAIQGNAALLERELGFDSDTAQEMAREILDSSRTASELTEQLLAFSRGDPAAASQVDLVDLVERKRGLLRRLLPENIILEAEVAEEPLVVEAPPAQLEQVLLNLVINARDAMPGGGRILVAVEPWSLDKGPEDGLVEVGPGEYVRLTVSDEGHGIPRHVRARIFEPFFTTKAALGGTGMGLATVYGVVARAGGSVHVESSPGAGATFRVLLPRQERMEAAPSQGPATHGPASGETILLVEDEDAVRKVARRILERTGYRVRAAVDGEQALELVKAGEPFDMLLTDVVMPGMTGPELASEVVRLRPEVPILFVSGYADMSLESEGLA